MEEGDEGGLEDILQVFKIFKLARVLKLARHSPGLQAIAYTLKNSMKELGLLVFLITISGLIFASFTYFIEIGTESGQDSPKVSLTSLISCLRSDLHTDRDLLGGRHDDHGGLRRHRSHHGAGQTLRLNVRCGRGSRPLPPHTNHCC